VVVELVAELGRVGPGVRVAVVAVAGGGDVAARRRARRLGHRLVAVAVRVGVAVPGGRVHGVLVDDAVAVVVDVVAGLDPTRKDARVGVVAVVVGLDVALGRGAGGDRGRRVTVPVVVGVRVEGLLARGAGLVDVAVAVVVDAVA